MWTMWAKLFIHFSNMHKLILISSHHELLMKIRLPCSFFFYGIHTESFSSLSLVLGAGNMINGFSSPHFCFSATAENIHQVHHRTAILIQFFLFSFVFPALSRLHEIIEHRHRDIIELWKTCTTSRESCNARPRNRSQFRITGKSILAWCLFSYRWICYSRLPIIFTHNTQCAVTLSPSLVRASGACERVTLFSCQ